MNIPEIRVVKDELEAMKHARRISAWELPYENLLTRLDAAIFFADINTGGDPQSVFEPLSRFPCFRFRENSERKLSAMSHRIEFNPVPVAVEG